MRHPLTALPQMMALTQVPLLSWPIAWQSAKSGSPGSNSSLNGSAAQAAPAPIPEKYRQSLQQECLTRNNRFLRGLNRYVRSTAAGPQPNPSESIPSPYGTLHLYRSHKAEARRRPLIFCIPSLINKYYILDLTPETSLMQAVNEMGFDAAMVEWNLPTEADAGKDIAAYVSDVLALLQAQWEHIDRPIIALGYCMGGILATALAQLFERVQGLVLLAAPWDYAEYPLARVPQAQQARWRELIQQEPLYSADAVQTLMILANNNRLYKRFARFADATDPEEIQQFVALEHWANDGMPLTQRVAEECLLEWPVENPLLNGEWAVEGEKIRPESLKIPALAALPQRDAIVPEAVSRPLAQTLPNCDITQPCGGHVGMVAGDCRIELQRALNGWLKRGF